MVAERGRVEGSSARAWSKKVCKLAGASGIYVETGVAGPESIAPPENGRAPLSIS